jgi:hypothetical protein
MWDEKHICVLKKRKEVIELLPNVKPRKAKWLIDELNLYFGGSLVYDSGPNTRDCTSYEINGITITEPEFKSMIVYTYNLWGEEVDYITPEGAALLVKMYRAGCFELKGKPGSTEELENYAASGEELMAAYTAKAELEATQKAEENYWKEHPEDLPEELFTAARLNDIMWHHGVKGMHVSMDIGGITVTKAVSRRKSNSGKSSDNTVVLSWTGSDGIPREEFLTRSAYENNRRNDADRNWGLPE